MLKLFGSYTSPFVRHCRILLDELNLAYELENTDYQQSAQLSLTQRVPFMDTELGRLSDSSSIIQYIRQKNNQSFLESPLVFDRWALINTALETCVNIFLLEKDGIDRSKSDYIRRQHDRVHGIMNELNAMPLVEPNTPLAEWQDNDIRLACFIQWAEFRDRLDLTRYPQIADWASGLRNNKVLMKTYPQVV